MSRTAQEVPGWWVEFLANVLRQLPRPMEIEQTTAETWSNNQEALRETMKRVLLQGVGFVLSDTFQVTVPQDFADTENQLHVALWADGDEVVQVDIADHHVNIWGHGGVDGVLAH